MREYKKDYAEALGHMTLRFFPDQKRVLIFVPSEELGDGDGGCIAHIPAQEIAAHGQKQVEDLRDLLSRFLENCKPIAEG